MKTISRTLTPTQIRAVAHSLDGPSVGPIAKKYRDGAADLRTIADALDRGETVSVVRPAYRVEYKPPRAQVKT